MVCSNKWAGLVPCNLYAMDVDRKNRNCYNCGWFGYLARNCRNRGTGDKIEKERRLEYKNRNNKQRRTIEGGNGQDNNLNGEWDLILLNWVSIIISIQYFLE